MSEDEIRGRVEQFYRGRAEFLMHLVTFVLVNAAFWAVWALAQGTISLVWPMVVTLGWGSGLAGHAIEWLAKDPRRLARINRAAEQRMAQLYGPDWEVLSSDDDFHRMRAAVWRQFNHNKELGIHVAVYICINLMTWLIWAAAQGTMSILFPLGLLLLWGAGLAGHAMNNYFDSSRSVVARERAVQRALSRYNGEDDAPVEKRKRGKLKHMLTDDGEILDIVDDDGSEQEHRSHA